MTVIIKIERDDTNSMTRKFSTLEQAEDFIKKAKMSQNKANLKAWFSKIWVEEWQNLNKANYEMKGENNGSK